MDLSFPICFIIIVFYRQIHLGKTKNSKHWNMSKRGSGDIYGDVGAVDPKKPRRFKDKHSLDSDEEDAPDNYQVMDQEDIEGFFMTNSLYFILHVRMFI